MIRKTIYTTYVVIGIAMGMSAYVHGGCTIGQALFVGVCWPIYFVMLLVMFGISHKPS